MTALDDRVDALAHQLHDASMAAAQLADDRDQEGPEAPVDSGLVSRHRSHAQNRAVREDPPIATVTAQPVAGIEESGRFT